MSGVIPQVVTPAAGTGAGSSPVVPYAVAVTNEYAGSAKMVMSQYLVPAAPTLTLPA